MIELFKEAVILVDLPGKGLLRDDVGVVVEIYGNHEGYEVEFMTKQGRTIAVETLMPDQVRAISNMDISHVRSRTPVADSIQVMGDEEAESAEESTPDSATSQPNTVIIELADSVLRQQSLTIDKAKLNLALALFQQNFFSLGKASEFAGLHPSQFQKELAKRQLSVHYDVDEYQQDMDTLDGHKDSSRTYQEVR